jgi:hypothetical protein
MKYRIAALVILISGPLLGQTGEHYVSNYCDCYIDSTIKNESQPTPFTPTHSEVDSAEVALRRTRLNIWGILNSTGDSLKDYNNKLNLYIRIYRGYYTEDGDKILWIDADFEDQNATWVIYYDLKTKEFYNFRSAKD